LGAFQLVHSFSFSTIGVERFPWTPRIPLGIYLDGVCFSTPVCRDMLGASCLTSVFGIFTFFPLSRPRCVIVGIQRPTSFLWRRLENRSPALPHVSGPLLVPGRPLDISYPQFCLSPFFFFFFFFFFRYASFLSFSRVSVCPSFS